MSRLILLATYWNEIDWIDLSLKQIDLIKPDIIIINKGCFDKRYPNQSDDGTDIKVENFCSERTNCILCNSIRFNRLKHFIKWFFSYHLFISPRESINGVKYILKSNIYRLNQMQTFNSMIKLSGIRENDWIMTYDADQFYNDKMIKYFRNKLGSTDADMITGKEITFFEGFQNYFPNFSKQDYNNLPTKFNKRMRFIPTRNLSVPLNGKYVPITNTNFKKEFLGFVYHYKFKSQSRYELTYLLGNRKKPQYNLSDLEVFDGKHPSLVEKSFLRGGKPDDNC